MKEFYSQRFIVSVALCCIYLIVWAQVPDGYYDGADGKGGSALKTALSGIIRNHTERSYSNLWTDFEKTDKTSEGFVWDMYSSKKYVFGEDQNHGQSSDSYNREHSFPKSWFNDAKPMYTDLFHLYPTDVQVNSQRGNYPFGETDNGKKAIVEARGVLGKSSYPGYLGTVFEPDDEYKGDFARTYFYMVTCYEQNVSSWKCDMLNGTSYPAFSTWAMNMLLEWSRKDPVSQKEIDRNNAVYKIQKNRNPFIDLKGIEEYIWGNKKDEIYSPTGIFNGIKVSNFSVSAVDGKIRVTTDKENLVRIYDVVGRLIKQTIVDTGDTEFSLPSGMYIVNGHKVAL